MGEHGASSPGAGWRAVSLDVRGHGDSEWAVNGDYSFTANAADCVAIAGQLGMRPLVAHCHLGLGKLYRRTGSSQQAHEHLAIATTMYREMDMKYWLEQVEAEMRESE